jgi:hypothetical protein
LAFLGSRSLGDFVKIWISKKLKKRKKKEKRETLGRALLLLLLLLHMGI